MAGWGELQVVVARALCRFGRFDLSRLPAARRRAALSLQLQGWAPFQEPDFAVIWREDGHAVVWCWDAAALQRAWGDQGQAGKLPRAVPESALREPPLGDALRLFEGLNGFEAQRWRGGELVVSRWWPARPTAIEQLQFLRECGLGPDAVFDTPASSPGLATRPWGALSRLAEADAAVSGQERLGYWALAFCLAAPLVFLATDQARLWRAKASAQAELALASEESRGLTDAREAAMTKAEQVRSLQQLNTYPSPLMVMMALARALPQGGGSTIREWELNDGKLRVLLVSPGTELAGADHVRALEAAGLFSDVKLLTQTDPRQMAFSLQLRNQQALSAPAASAASGGAP